MAHRFEGAIVSVWSPFHLHFAAPELSQHQQIGEPGIVRYKSHVDRRREVMPGFFFRSALRSAYMWVGFEFLHEGRNES